MRMSDKFAIAGIAGLSVVALAVGTMARGQEAPAAGAGAAPPAAANPAGLQLTPIAIPPTPNNAAPHNYNYNYVLSSSDAPGNRVWVYQSTKKSHQENADLIRRTEELASRYVDAKEEQERQKIKAELTEWVAKQFDLQQKMREEEVAEIEARVKKLRELIEKRKAAQQSIIEHRLDQLLREAEGLGWTPPAERAGQIGARVYSRDSAAVPVPVAPARGR